MAGTILAAEIGDRIMALRTARGWSQPELARRAGLASKTLISNYELGYRSPSCESLLRIADAFGVTADYLLRGDNSDTPDAVGLETQPDGDTYLRIRAGTLTKSQMDAIMSLVRKLHNPDD